MTNLISRTGRVQSWMDDPTGRLPVSCTVFVVDNEMEGPNGIEASGGLPVMLYDMEQVVQSIYLNLTIRLCQRVRSNCFWSCQFW